MTQNTLNVESVNITNMMPNGTHYDRSCLCTSCKVHGNRRYIGGGTYNINDKPIRQNLEQVIKEWKESFALEFPSWLTNELDEFLTRYGKSIAEKTVEAVRVEKEANLGYYGYKTSEQYGKVLGRNETVHELETKASRWLGKEEV